MDFSISALYITVFYIIGICLSHFSKVSATNSAPRWEMPCGVEVMPPSNPAFPPPPTEPPQDPADIVASITIRIHEALSYSINLKQNMSTERIRSNSRLRLLNGVSLSGFPNLPENSEAEIEKSLQNITQTKLDTYRDLSIVAAFFEQMKLDEIIYEDSYYVKNIGKIEDKMYDILCNLYTALRNLDAEISHVTRESMDKHIISIEDKTDRHDRDYIIVKDTERLMDHLLRTYTAMHYYLDESA